MTKPFLIPDGYTRTVGFNATDDFEEYNFTYRGLRGLERSTYVEKMYLPDQRIDAADDVAARKESWLQMLTSQVSGWSISSDFLEDVSIADPEIVRQITDVVMGDRLPDFEIDKDGEKVTPSTDEDDSGNSTPG